MRTELYDVIVIGAGPAGLATSVYAGSEGLSVLAIDCRSFGGQAGASARIENYLGFPTGISGMALMGRAFSQAQKFGVEIAIPDEAVKLECGNEPCHVLLATGERIQARSVVIATGADIAGWVSSGSTSSKARRFTTGPRRSKPTFAPVRKCLGRRRQFGWPGDRISR